MKISSEENNFCSQPSVFGKVIRSELSFQKKGILQPLAFVPVDLLSLKLLKEFILVIFIRIHVSRVWLTIDSAHCFDRIWRRIVNALGFSLQGVKS